MNESADSGTIFITYDNTVYVCYRSVRAIMLAWLKQSKFRSMVAGVFAVSLVCALAITPFAFASSPLSDEGESSGTSQSASSSSAASSNSATSSASSAKKSTVLEMRTLAQKVADGQNMYMNINSEEDKDGFLAIVEQNRTYFTDEFYSQAAPWFNVGGTWQFSGTRMTKDDLYQVLWTCVDDEGNILAYASGAYLSGQNKFTDASHADTIYGAQLRPASGDVDANIDASLDGMRAMIEQIKALHGDQPAPEREDRYGEDADYDEVQQALREAEESQAARDWFREHGVEY